ncbi:uncharacterized protein LOC122514972 [Polistes fuscatus]|uniref:uncharacterized protein LOC122514972 n=1 Tax=Polistes fuscatus TaxID=30207 RepID=UPI001CA7C3E9|nr:uncharacterized protein LOC122514972 [Polistes fuscatus]
MSSETIITNICTFYELNYRLLLLTGLWPYQEGLELLFRVIVISICFIGGIILQLKNISGHIAFDCNQLSNENEFIIMQKYARTNKRITLAITLGVYLYCIMLLFPLIIHILLYNTDDINDTQLVQLPFPIDPSLIDIKSKFFYVIVLLEIFALIILSTVAIVTITSFFLCIDHACAALSIIICKIEQPWKTNSKDLTCDYVTMCDACNWIRDIVRSHVNVIK